MKPSTEEERLLQRMGEMRSLLHAKEAENARLRGVLQDIANRREGRPMTAKTAEAFADIAHITLHGIDDWVKP